MASNSKIALIVLAALLVSCSLFMFLDIYFTYSSPNGGVTFFQAAQMNYPPIFGEVVLRGSELGEYCLVESHQCNIGLDCKGWKLSEVVEPKFGRCSFESCTVNSGGIDPVSLRYVCGDQERYGCLPKSPLSMTEEECKQLSLVDYWGNGYALGVPRENSNAYDYFSYKISDDYDLITRFENGFCYIEDPEFIQSGECRYLEPSDEGYGAESGYPGNFYS